MSDTQGIMASLDVESLFTNVPIADTIDIIADYMYRSPDKHPPQIPEAILRTMLEHYTAKSPFISPKGSMEWRWVALLGLPLPTTTWVVLKTKYSVIKNSNLKFIFVMSTILFTFSIVPMRLLFNYLL